MGAFDLPPDEAWWERALLEQGHGKDRVGAHVERHSSAERVLMQADPGTLDSRDPEYPTLAASAREFAQAVLARAGLPDGCEILPAAALRVVDQLASGHELGYEDSALCGNIVRCRWALAECRVCAETLSRIVTRMAMPEFAGLLDRCRALCKAIEDRIERLRRRIWW